MIIMSWYCITTQGSDFLRTTSSIFSGSQIKNPTSKLNIFWAWYDICDVWEIISDGVVLALQNAHFSYNQYWHMRYMALNDFFWSDTMKVNIFQSLHDISHASEPISKCYNTAAECPLSYNQYCHMRSLLFLSLWSHEIGGDDTDIFGKKPRHS